MKVKAIPEGFHSLTPDLVVNDVEAAVEFYRNALGAKKHKVFHVPGGSIMHAELLIGNSILMLSPENPEHNVFSPLSPAAGQAQPCSCMLKMSIRSMRRLFPRAPL